MENMHLSVPICSMQSFSPGVEKSPEVVMETLCLK